MDDLNARRRAREAQRLATEPGLREARRAYNTAWRARRQATDFGREAQRRNRIMHEYGISLEAYDAFLAAPCGICGQASEHLDHDHATGRVRGGLCAACNKGLGQFRDSEQLLLAAAVYVATKAAKEDAA